MCKNRMCDIKLISIHLSHSIKNRWDHNIQVDVLVILRNMVYLSIDIYLTFELLFL